MFKPRKKPQESTIHGTPKKISLSTWAFVSEDATRDKNQKKGAFFSRVKKYCDAAREENPEGMRERNEIK